MSARMRAATLAAGLLWLGSPATADETWAPRVSATYKVVAAGFDLGKFTFTSTLTGHDYVLTGNGELSWGMGLLSWTSVTRSSGSVDGDHVAPAGYTLDYKTQARSGSVKLGFQHDAVTSVSVVPPSPPAAGTVPLKEHHLKSVFDPMSAIIALARGHAANPCGRRIAIFDGRQRFDLALSFRRQEKVVEARPSGQPVIAYVCRVQYTPVAGYPPSRNTQAMAATAGIEVALRPIPTANLLVPHRITIPTMIGTVELLATRVDITAPGNRQIALTQH